MKNMMKITNDENLEAVYIYTSIFNNILKRIEINKAIIIALFKIEKKTVILTVDNTD